MTSMDGLWVQEELDTYSEVTSWNSLIDRTGLNLLQEPISLSWKAISKNFFVLQFREMFDKTLVTVWSAPNYCYRCGNVAAILEFDENLNKNYKIFEAAP